MTIKRFRNEFFFIDSLGFRYFGSTMDFRPVLTPTGWVLYTKNAKGLWITAEYGVAYSMDAAKLHAHTAKNRHIRKTLFFGKYMAELSKMQRDNVEKYVSEKPWKVEYFETESDVKPNKDWRYHSVKLAAEAVTARDKDRLERLGLEKEPTRGNRNQTWFPNTGNGA
jgi:hypothetical protein